MIKATALLAQLQDHEFDTSLADLYGNDHNTVAGQRTRYSKAITKYIELYGDDEIEIYSAPGRTEICGNHTDHQNGRILAASVNLDMIAVVSKSHTTTVDFVSEGYPPISCDISSLDIRDSEKGTTTALIKGVIKGMHNHGYNAGAFKAYVTSDVLNGSGLSSSAATESLLGIIQSGLYNNLTVSAVEIADIGHFAEVAYFGKPCGMMDEIACSVGSFVFVDFENPNAPVVRNVDYDILSSGYRLCIVDTKGSHANLTDDYAAVPAEMNQVASLFGKEHLNEINFNDFTEKLPDIYGKVSDRAILRAYHFLSENQRVGRAVCALESDRFDTFLSIIRESGDSSYKYLQNVYSGKYTDKQPIPVALALSSYFLKDNGVCRVHGGGFAGTIQAFVKEEYVSEYKEFIEKILGKDTCHVLSIRRQGCIKVL